MKNVYKQKREQGFTIIEVLIVLAIAALIFLIVFLAVPALQRNSRNNAIKHDAADLLSAVQTFESNNNGQLPSVAGGVSCSSGTATIHSTVAGTQDNTIALQPSTGCSSVGSSAPSWPGVSAIVIDIGYDCTNNTAVTANSRSVAALFVVETGGSTTAKQCLAS